MVSLELSLGRRRPHVLCLGAHSDDIEIGCAATLLAWKRRGPLQVTWAVLSAPGARAREARASAAALMRGCGALEVIVGDFEDALFPADFRKIKRFLADLRSRCNPDVIFTHYQEDRHQDHRLVADMTWQLWREHLILEYEIAKYEGDLGNPNLFVAATADATRKKVRHLERRFVSQRSKPWFKAEMFEAIMRLRGAQCRSASGFAEAFYARKLTL